MARTSDATPSIDLHALRHQEVLFTLVMGVIALLSRENPLVRAPDILWAFAAMLGFNLASHRALRVGRGPAAALLSVAANVVLASAVVHCSGGSASSFWPLYLLPVFTACLHLEARHVAAAWLASAGFLACFYLEGFWASRGWDVCEFLIKLGVLAVSGAVTARLSAEERAGRAAAAESRERVEQLARSLERRSATELLAQRRQSLSTLVPGIVHALQNPLTVVLGSVELLIKEAPEGSLQRQDLERIRAAARRCAQVGEDLLAQARAEARMGAGAG